MNQTSKSIYVLPKSSNFFDPFWPKIAWPASSKTELQKKCEMSFSTGDYKAQVFPHLIENYNHD